MSRAHSAHLMKPTASSVRLEAFRLALDDRLNLLQDLRGQQGDDFEGLHVLDNLFITRLPCDMLKLSCRKQSIWCTTEVGVAYLALFGGSSDHWRHVGVRCAPRDTQLGHRDTELRSDRFEPVHFSKRVVNQRPVGQVLERETQHPCEDHSGNTHRLGKLIQDRRVC